MLRTVSPNVTCATRKKALGVTVGDLMAREACTSAQSYLPLPYVQHPMSVVSPVLKEAPVVERLRSRSMHLRSYVALTKPRIVELLLVTTLPTMFVARRGVPSVVLMVATLAGGALAAGGANAINMVVDRDIDRVMRRTRHRPLVTGEFTPTAALVFAMTLELVAFAELWFAVNLLSALLAMAAIAFYVFVYTLWLKRTSTLNIVIGGAAGAVPVLVGWAAVTDRLGWASVVLSAVVFLWTPPHFWALAVRCREDYEAAHIPMLPVVAPFARTSRQILLYALALVGVTLVVIPVAHMGLLYTTAATVLGALLLGYALRLRRAETFAAAMALFRYSITYLTLLFVVLAADVMVRFH
jgi:protoheme IX farnesyltransferase